MNGGDAVTDAELIRYLDGELESAERARVEALIAAAPAIADRAHVLRRRGTRLGTLLAAVDPSDADVRASATSIRRDIAGDVRPHVPRAHGWRRTQLLRAAALMAALLGGTLLVEPARAWIIEQMRAAAVASGLIEPTPTAPAAPVAPPSIEPGWRFSLPWSTDSFELDAGDAVGTLVIRRGTGPSAIIESADAGVTRIAITPLGMRLIGAGTGVATYTLTLPPTVSRLHLVRAGTPEEIPIAPDLTELLVPLR